MSSREAITKEQVNEILAGSYTEAGIQRWWHRPRIGFAHRSPAQVWMNNPDAVLRLAQGVATFPTAVYFDFEHME